MSKLSAALTPTATEGGVLYSKLHELLSREIL